MKLVEIYPGIIWSAFYDGDKKHVLMELFEKWLDTEYIDDYVEKNKRYLKDNLFFAGYSLIEVKKETSREVRGLKKRLDELYQNHLNGEHPNFDDRFYILNRKTQKDDLRREMYGHPKSIDQMISVLRIYAIKIPTKQKHDSAAYIIAGGGIKFTDAMQDMKALNREFPKMKTVQGWLERNKITNKQELIEYLKKWNQDK